MPHLASPAGHVVVDDHLAAVGEVPELRLPDDEGPRPAQGEPVFEAEHRVLGQRAVVDGELGLVGRTGWRAGCRAAGGASPRPTRPGGAGRRCRARCPGRSAECGTPCSSSDPKARDSANAQSTVPSCSSRAAFSSTIRLSLGCMWKPGGHGGERRGNHAQAVLRRRRDPSRSSSRRCAPVRGRRHRGRPVRATAWSASFSAARKLRAHRLFLLLREDARPPGTSPRTCVGGLFFFSMIRYMSGCVKEGSSPSLCPYLR